MSDVTIAVVSWNTRELLASCLDSLRPEVEAGRADVWVVDNASSDGSPELVRDRYGWVTLVALDDNLGYGPAVNLVARQTETEWLAPSNADIRLTPGSLERMLDVGRADEAVGAVAPRLVLPDGTTQDSVFAFPTLPYTAAATFGLLGLSRRLSSRWPTPGRWDPETPVYVPWAVAAFLLVRREAWDRSGGFDDDQWMYAEDLELGWRLAQAGWRTRYEPTAGIHHDESAAVAKAWGPERWLRWHRSTYAWLLRRRGPVRTRTIAALNVLGFGVRAVLLAPLSVVSPARWKQRRRDAVNAMRAHRIGLAARRELESVR